MRIRFAGYRGIRFMRGEKDESIGALRTMIRDDEHLNNNQVERISGVKAGTIKNWFDGDTKKPQNATMMAVSSALGYLRRDHRNADGTVSPGFVKDLKSINYAEEMVKQADWLLKHGHTKKKGAKKKKKPARE
jgi:hypothetical protein